MGRLLKFQIELISERRSNPFTTRPAGSTERRRSSTASQQDWFSLTEKLKTLATLAPATAKSLEDVIDEALRQLVV